MHDHGCAGPGGELDGVVADGAGSSRNQNDLALQRTRGEHAAVGGLVACPGTQGGALGERNVRGQFGDQIGVQTDVLQRRCPSSGRYAARCTPDALADPAFGETMGPTLVDYCLHRRGLGSLGDIQPALSRGGDRYPKDLPPQITVAPALRRCLAPASEARLER